MTTQFGMKLRQWMETHFSRNKKKKSKDENGNVGKKVKRRDNLSPSGSPGNFLSSTKTSNFPKISCLGRSPSDHKNFLSANQYPNLNLSSPESAYSTAHSDDGVSPHPIVTEVRGGVGLPPGFCSPFLPRNQEYYSNIASKSTYSPSMYRLVFTGQNSLDDIDETMSNHGSEHSAEVPSAQGTLCSSNGYHSNSFRSCHSNSAQSEVSTNDGIDDKKPPTIRTSFAQIAEDANGNLNSPRQRSKIKTNPWVSNSGSKERQNKRNLVISAEYGHVPINLDRNHSFSSAKTCSTTDSDAIASDMSMSSRSEKSFMSISSNRSVKTRSSDASDGVVSDMSGSYRSSISSVSKSYSNSSTFSYRSKWSNEDTKYQETPGSLDKSARSSLHGASSSDECTLNEIGKFEEGYVFEKETDILSDSDMSDKRMPSAEPQPSELSDDFDEPTEICYIDATPKEEKTDLVSESTHSKPEDPVKRESMNSEERVRRGSTHSEDMGKCGSTHVEEVVRRGSTHSEGRRGSTTSEEFRKGAAYIEELGRMRSAYATEEPVKRANVHAEESAKQPSTKPDTLPDIRPQSLQLPVSSITLMQKLKEEEELFQKQAQMDKEADAKCRELILATEDILRNLALDAMFSDKFNSPSSSEEEELTYRLNIKDCLSPIMEYPSSMSEAESPCVDIPYATLAASTSSQSEENLERPASVATPDSMDDKPPDNLLPSIESIFKNLKLMAPQKSMKDEATSPMSPMYDPFEGMCSGIECMIPTLSNIPEEECGFSDSSLMSPDSSGGLTPDFNLPNAKSLEDLRQSLAEKVRLLQQEKLSVEAKVREAQQEERLRQEDKRRLQEEMGTYKRQVLLHALQALKKDLEEQSARLQDAYRSTISMQIQVRRQRSVLHAKGQKPSGS